MALEALESRMGRKMAHPGTVRINKGNVLRISADVHLSDHYLPMIDRAKKLVVLVKADRPGPNVLNTWTSNKKARSPLISATRFLEQLGLDSKRALG